MRFSCKSCLDTLCYENYQRLINISKLQEISTVSTLIFWGCLNTEDFHPSPIIYSWVITWIEANKVWSPFVSCSHTRSNTQRIFSCSEEIMNVPVLTEYTDSTMNVRLSKNQTFRQKLQSWQQQQKNRQIQVNLTNFFHTTILLEKFVKLHDSHPKNAELSQFDVLVSYRNFSWKIRQTARFTCTIAQNQVDLTTTFLIAISLRQIALFITYFSVFFISGKRRFNIKLWKTFTDCFNCLPIAAIVDEKIFCCHGGLSPDLQSMEQIRRIMRPTDVPDTGKNFNFTKNRQKSQKAIWRILI